MSDETSGESPEQGEIMFADAGHGMLNTTSGLTLNFELSQCAGFVPAAGNIVAIAKVDGMNASGLTLIAERAPSRYAPKPVPEEQVAALRAEATSQAPSAQLSVSGLERRSIGVNWGTTFESIERQEAGLSPAVLVQALASAQRPFEEVEIKLMVSGDASITSLLNPLTKLGEHWPASWLSFLLWSNGGDFISGQRAFQDMFSVDEVREFTVVYGLPHCLPGAIPFAMDGGGGFYLFDTREGLVEGEYPIVFCHTDDVPDGWSEVVVLESSFIECCRATTHPDD